MLGEESRPQNRMTGQQNGIRSRQRFQLIPRSSKPATLSSTSVKRGLNIGEIGKPYRQFSVAYRRFIRRTKFATVKESISTLCNLSGLIFGNGEAMLFQKRANLIAQCWSFASPATVLPAESLEHHA